MHVEEVFRERFGSDPALVTIAPGRVNLIGEHTDYNEGFVLPAAIDRHVKVAISPTEGPSEIFSVQRDRGNAFDTRELAPGTGRGWSGYVAGVAWSMARASKRILPNVRAVVDSTLPIGAGVSSSAALELAFAVAWNALADLDLPNEELAKLAQVAENEYVGVNCGIMDQMASAMGKSGCAMFLDTKSLEITYARIPDDLVIVLCDTQKSRSLAGSAYNERRKECEAACRALGVTSLRNVPLVDLESHWDSMPETIYNRALHVVTENARCISFVDALDKRNSNKIRMLMQASHESLRDHYAVSCEELDAMAEAAWDAPGCVGARMTGAGFGGACVALVEESRVDAFIRSTGSRYQMKTGTEGVFTSCRASRGAHVLRN